MAENQTFPKIPENTWWILRDQFQKTPPRVVSPTYLKSLLNYSSEKAARNLLSPLRQLGLIDDSGEPTNRANDWRLDEKYQQVCEQMLVDVYPQELRDLYQGKQINKQNVANWFMHNSKVGRDAARQAAALYILLNDATPRSSTELKKTSTSPKTKPKASKPKTKPSESVSRPVQEIDEDIPIAAQIPEPVQAEESRTSLAKGISLHIDLQVHISPEANADQIDQIFASIAKHLTSSNTLK